MIVNIKAMQTCIRYMRNVNKNVTADDFEENNCFIKVKRFYKGIASKFTRKGNKNEGNKKTIFKS